MNVLRLDLLERAALRADVSLPRKGQAFRIVNCVALGFVGCRSERATRRLRGLPA
jgi:hypothetical protein